MAGLVMMAAAAADEKLSSIFLKLPGSRQDRLTWVGFKVKSVSIHAYDSNSSLGRPPRSFVSSLSFFLVSSRQTCS